MYDRIVVPTDGSTGSAHVAMQAFDLAEQYGAAVSIVHVVDGGLRTLVGDDAPNETLRERGQRAVATLEALADAYDITVDSEVRDGDPAGEILAVAEEVDADLLVMGTHGRSGIERRLIGSVAERVVRRSEVPVMTVRLPNSSETVQDRGTAADIVASRLTDQGYDATIDGVERQLSVWVVEASTADGEAFTVYVDPVTRRTSAVPRATGA